MVEDSSGSGKRGHRAVRKADACGKETSEVILREAAKFASSTPCEWSEAIEVHTFCARENTEEKRKRREGKRRRWKMEERAIMRAPSIRNYADVAPHRNR